MRARHSVVAMAILAVAGCGSDSAGPDAENTSGNAGPGSGAGGVALSAPVADPSAAGTVPATAVFVSASPGTVAKAASAQIRIGTGPSRTAAAIDGGFDPISVPAGAGDQVIVTITDSAGKSTTRTRTAKERARPRVVRTSPAPHRTDVPLNAIIRVVFSAPMTLESVADGVGLLHDGVPVPATVVASDASALTFEVQPRAELEPGVSYQVVVAATVQDVNGTALGVAVSTSFTTEIPSRIARATLQVIVRTEGMIPPDGYSVSAANEIERFEGRVDSNGTLLLPVGFPGSYVVKLSAGQYCSVDGGPVRQVDLSRSTVTEEFLVRCPGDPASTGAVADSADGGTVRIYISTPDTIPGLTFVIWQYCDWGPCRSAIATATEPAVFERVPPGNMELFVLSLELPCWTIPWWESLFLDVQAGKTTDADFWVSCTGDPPNPALYP